MNRAGVVVVGVAGEVGRGFFFIQIHFFSFILLFVKNSQKQVLKKRKYLNYQVNPDYTRSQPKLRRYEEKNSFAKIELLK